MPEKRLIRLFLSSPGDVAEERRIVHLIRDRLRTDRDLRDRCDLQVVAWDDPDSDTAMIASLPPQVAINAGMGRPAACEIVVVILWSRMGTPTHVEGRDYQSGTHFEFLDADEASLRNGGYPNPPITLIYRRTQSPTFSGDDPKIREKLAQYEQVKQFFDGDLFWDAQRRPLRGVNLYDSPAQFEEMLERALKKQIGVLLAQPVRRPSAPPEAAPSALPAWQGSPFPGLRAFTAADEPIYFGRTLETSQVIDLLRARRFVAIVGSSGSGKSSLVGAGVIPKLRANVIEGSRDWVIVRFTPGELGANPLIALADRTMQQIATPYASPTDLAEALAADPAGLDRMIGAILADRKSWAELLFFVDQFEELITVADDAPRAAAIAVLSRLAAHPRARVVITLRADFYNRVVEIEPLAHLLNAGTYALSAPGQGALYEMITRPAERAGLTFEEGLPDTILTDTGSDPGALALMAFALDELYDETVSAGGTRLTRAVYTRIGGVQGAIAARADETFAALDSEAQAALPRVFQELVRIDDRGVPTRARALLGGFDGDAPARALIDRFIARRLLIAGQGQENAPTIEVAHEALFRGWARLVTWIDEAAGDLRLQEAVRRAAADWEAHDHDPEYLWSNSRNAEVSAMIRRRDWKADATVLAFIRSELDRLLDAIADPATAPARRAEIGLTLAILGDTRPGVGVTRDGIPDIAWVEVISAAGAFQVARYPVTIAQYQAYINDTRGHAKYDSRSALEQQVGVLRSDLALQAGDTRSNQPITGITWHEAVAFCAWLSDKTGLAVRLPTIGERAAIMAYSDLRQTGDRAGNTLEQRIGLAAVGLFPADAPGLHDLRGNVLEWGMEAVPPLTYPRTGQRSADLRPLFGRSHGRIAVNAPDVQCANPDQRLEEWGFRVVVSALPVPVYVPPPPSPPQQQPISQKGKAGPRRIPVLLQLLPRLRFPERTDDFQLVYQEALTSEFDALRADVRARVLRDLAFLDPELRKLFRERDYQAAVNQNRYRLIEISKAGLVLVVITAGSLGLWLIFTQPGASVVAGFFAVLAAMMSNYLITISARSAPFDGHFAQRRTAEFLRREYFRYLARLTPYHQADSPSALKLRLAQRVAFFNRGGALSTQAGEVAPASVSIDDARQPRYLFYDREQDELTHALVTRFLLDDMRHYYRAIINRNNIALRQSNQISVLAVFIGAACIALAGLLTSTAPDSPVSPLLIVIALIAGSIALFFFLMPLLYQWERLIIIYKLSLESLEMEDARSPLADTTSDRAYRLELERFAEAVLKVMEDETAQYGKPPVEEEA